MSNNFPHDGEHGRTCTSYGCDCDEKNYGTRGSGYGGGGSSNSGCGFLIWIIVGSAVGAYNELLGVIVLIVGAFILLMCR